MLDPILNFGLCKICLLWHLDYAPCPVDEGFFRPTDVFYAPNGYVTTYRFHIYIQYRLVWDRELAEKFYRAGCRVLARDVEQSLDLHQEYWGASSKTDLEMADDDQR